MGDVAPPRHRLPDGPERTQKGWSRVRRYRRSLAKRLEAWLIKVGVLATPEEDEIYSAYDIYLDGLISEAELHRRLDAVTRSDSPLPVTLNERLDGTFGHGFTAGIRADVDRENSQRYVNTHAVIEWADLRTTGDVVNDITGRRGFWMPEADWNRIVAVARGNVSEAAQKVIDRVLSGDLS